MLCVSGAATLEQVAVAFDRLFHHFVHVEGGFTEPLFDRLVGPTVLPMGVVGLFGAEDLSGGQRAEMAEVLVGYLVEVGVSDAVVSVPPTTEFFSLLFITGPTVVLAVYPHPDSPDRASIVDGWLAAGVEWLESQAEGLVRCRLAEVYAGQVDLATAGRRASSVVAAGSSADFVAGELDELLRGVAVNAEPEWACFTAMVAGPGLTETNFVEHVERLVELGRELGEVAYAVVATQPKCSAWHNKPMNPDGRSPYHQHGPMMWFQALDGFFWQRLGPGHFEVLGGRWPEGAVPLASGGAELTVGEVQEWWPDVSSYEISLGALLNARARTRAREALGDLLLARRTKKWCQTVRRMVPSLARVFPEESDPPN